MLISIIIPTYNVENYIEECVHSAFAQTHANIEVICIDNNSTDRTWNKLEHLRTQYPNLIIDKEDKSGAPAARNKGLTLSKGNWLQFLDADDLLSPTKIEHQINLLNGDNNICFIAATFIKQDLSYIQTVATLRQDHPFKSLFTTSLGITSSNLWHREYIEQINGWDEDLKSSQEADLIFRLLKNSNHVVFDFEPLTIIRERPYGQISHRDQNLKWKAYILTRTRIFEWIASQLPNHFSSNVQWYKDALFEHLRVLAQHDINEATNIFIEILGEDYSPKSKKYRFLFKLLGFKRSEQFRQYLKW